MGYSSSIKILLIVISLVIIFTYIKPTFEEMKATQVEAEEYQVALENAASFNAELQRLAAKANAFSAQQLRSLERYLPNSVDTVAVMRDIEIIVNNNNLTLDALSSSASEQGIANTAGVAQGQAASAALPVYSQQFTLTVTGTYEQFKTLLQDFERNAYPLEVANISFTPADEGQYSFDITLETYSMVIEEEN